MGQYILLSLPCLLIWLKIHVCRFVALCYNCYAGINMMSNILYSWNFQICEMLLCPEWVFNPFTLYIEFLINNYSGWYAVVPKFDWFSKWDSGFCISYLDLWTSLCQCSGTYVIFFPFKIQNLILSCYPSHFMIRKHSNWLHCMQLLL